MALALLMAAAVAAATPTHNSGLPLKRGLYVDVEMPCEGAIAADHSWYSGSGYVIQAPHAHCEALHVHRYRRKSFGVKETCRDESMPGSDYRVSERISVIGPGEYVARNRFGRFHARWCEE